jgi:hypothetical protein
MAGYSTTPLAKKLGIKPGTKLLLVNAPDDYLSLLAPLPQDLTIAKKLTDEVDLIHLFVTANKQLASPLKTWRKTRNQDTAIWVSWRNKAAKVATEITDNVIRDVAIPLGLVDINVCAIDDVWSGLKLVIRKHARRST